MLYCRIVLNCVCLLLYVWRIFNELSHNYICMTYIVYVWHTIITVMFELCEILTQLSYCIVLYVWRCAICICLTYRFITWYNAPKWTFIWWRYKRIWHTVKQAVKRLLSTIENTIKRQLSKYLWMFGRIFRSVTDLKMLISLLTC